RFPALPLPQWGPDILVNHIAADRPTYSYQRNPMMAVNPLNSNMVIAGYDSFQDTQFASGYAASADGGDSWTSDRFTGPWTSDDLVPIGNVSVGYDGFGTGYYVSQAVTNTLSGYFVLTTTNGTAWSAPVPIHTFDATAYRSQATMVV